MSPAEGNLAASIASRLLNRAKARNEDFQVVFTAYAIERLLYRLGRSDLRDRYLLKGAMLLRLWSDHPYRATRDLDLLRRGEGSFDAVRSELATICAVDVPPDGIAFDLDSLRIEAIRAQDEYAGARVRLEGRNGKSRLPLQIDLGVGDAVWPPPLPCDYPTLLDFPAPAILAYPREAVVAEKLEALVVLGDRNSRIKDFFDLHHIASRFHFDRPTLVESVRRTFARRTTKVPAAPPIGLTPLYWENPSRPAQVRAFARRAGLDVPERPERDLGELLELFLLPVLEDLRRGASSPGAWFPGGPWRTGSDRNA